MHFYFDIVDGPQTIRDEIGADMFNIDAARVEAIVALTGMARDWLPHDGAERSLKVVVREASRRLLEISVYFKVTSLSPDVPERDNVIPYESPVREPVQ